MTHPTDERIDGLYAGELDRFTPDRDALAKELTGAGDREGGTRVKALRKPVVSAWALNVLAHEDPEAMGSCSSSASGCGTRSAGRLGRGRRAAPRGVRRAPPPRVRTRR